MLRHRMSFNNKCYYYLWKYYFLWIYRYCMFVKYFYNVYTDFKKMVTWMELKKKNRSRFPTINMFYYTYISYEDYTILIHSFNCPAIKQVFLFFSFHLIIIINLLLLNIITHLIESSRFAILIKHHWTAKFSACFSPLAFSFIFFFFLTF